MYACWDVSLITLTFRVITLMFRVITLTFRVFNLMFRVITLMVRATTLMFRVVTLMFRVITLMFRVISYLTAQPRRPPPCHFFSDACVAVSVSRSEHTSPGEALSLLAREL